ncbi:hypothetical protein FD754_001463 [Muntiacus muntjak]|uniref:Uncharacterized protein n=1 Tax=Muntiacus muntjak TaxID=9888 RepID=A0A5N3W7U6_MUNMU|nr:hypothetical protein FD754_001463 [Muntiacus muntjak]
MGDVEKGRNVFVQKCAQRYKTGPDLPALFGRKREGVSRGEETDGHLENPRASVPGTKVIFADIQEGERGALIAYFKKAPKG